jgi:hypothetical protein
MQYLIGGLRSLEVIHFVDIQTALDRLRLPTHYENHHIQFTLELHCVSTATA